MARARQALPTHNGSNKEESARRGSGDNHSPHHAGIRGMPKMEEKRTGNDSCICVISPDSVFVRESWV